MFNLEVPTSEIKKIRDLLNKINSSYRVEKNEDGSSTLKFKTQEELDKATEVLKTTWTLDKKSNYMKNFSEWLSENENLEEAGFSKG